MAADIVLLILCLGLSAFFSGSETAFVSARRIKFLVWIKQDRKNARQVYDFLLKPQQYLATTLVGNNIAVVSTSILITLYLKEYLSGLQITLLSSAFLLVLGEIFPKFIGRHLANTISLYSYKVHQVFYLLFLPIIWFVRQVSQLVLRVLGIESDSVEVFFSRDDLDILVHEGQETGVINPEERLQISRMVLRGRRTVHEVMIPRTEISAVSRDATVKHAADLFLQSGYSRLPVMGEDIDHIVGMVYVSDLICEQPRVLSDIIRDILHVPDSLNMLNLLHTMRLRGQTMAIAVDEYGGTAGLVTIEDMIEEFFGEIEDEYDESVEYVNRIGASRLDVNARIEIDSLNERFGLNLPEGDYQTLGGLIISRLGRIPRKGEKMQLEKCSLIVLAAQTHKVVRVRILCPGDQAFGENS